MRPCTGLRGQRHRSFSRAWTWSDSRSNKQKHPARPQSFAHSLHMRALHSAQGVSNFGRVCVQRVSNACPICVQLWASRRVLRGAPLRTPVVGVCRFCCTAAPGRNSVASPLRAFSTCTSLPPLLAPALSVCFAVHRFPSILRLPSSLACVVACPLCVCLALSSLPLPVHGVAPARDGVCHFPCIVSQSSPYSACAVDSMPDTFEVYGAVTHACVVSMTRTRMPCAFACIRP